MSGHSKWKNTKRRKAIQDIKRGKIFSKIMRDVQTAAKLGGSDITSNSRLRIALGRALSNNIAKNTLNRAIFHHCHENKNKNMEHIVYEGYSPGGAALLLECFTNNKNRVVSEIRHILSKFGGNLGTSGSVTYLFRKQGVISCSLDFSEDVIIDTALKIGADDISVDNGVVKIYLSLKLLSKMELKLKSFKSITYTSKVLMVPYSYVDLNKDNSSKLSSIIIMLKSINDICEIYHNGNFFEN